MRLRVLVAVAMAGFLAQPVVALSIHDTSHLSEVSIHILYNDAYGTDYGSSQDLWDDVGLDGFETFALPEGSDDAFIEFAAHYAAYDQELWWYNPSDLDEGELLLTIGSGVGNQTPFFEFTGAFNPSDSFGLLDVVHNGEATWYSEASVNSDRNTHFAIFSTPYDNQYFIGVEDLSLGDRDYNDLVFTIAVSDAAVPEPTTWCLMLTAGAVIWVRRRFTVQ